MIEEAVVEEEETTEIHSVETHPVRVVVNVVKKAILPENVQMLPNQAIQTVSNVEK